VQRVWGPGRPPHRSPIRPLAPPALLAATLASLSSFAMLELMRWSNDKAARFQALRERDARGELSPGERAELDAQLAALDADEANVLGQATQRLRDEAEAMAKETASLDAKARELLRISEEEERLLADARATLERLSLRSVALAEDYLRVMGHELVPSH